MKRILAVIIALILFFSAVSFTAFAEERSDTDLTAGQELAPKTDLAGSGEDDDDVIPSAAEGSSDDNDLAGSGLGPMLKQGTTGTCMWLYLGSTMSLHIYGSGSMQDYSYEFSDKPWNDFRNDITSIIISDEVKDVGDYAFNNCKKVSSITLGSSMRSIGQCAFSGISAPGEITIPDSVTAIEPGAFMASGVTGVTFGSGLTEISEQAFQECKLKNITIPGNVRKIGRKAFYGNTDLTNVQLENGVESIGEYAFLNTGLGGVTIPKSVTEFGAAPFAYDVTYNQASHSNTYTPVNPFIIKGYTNSVAEDYAKSRSFITFISIGTVSNHDLVITVHSGLEKTDTTMVELYKKNASTPKYVLSLTGISAQQKITNIDVSVYTVKVSKKNHVARQYDLAITKQHQEVIYFICPIGDANQNQSVTSADASTIYKHLSGTKLIDDPYAFQCADVNKSNTLTSADASAIYKHLNGSKKLF